MLQSVKVVLVEMGSDLQGVYNYRPGQSALLSINERLEGTDEFFEVLFKFYAMHFQLNQRQSPLPFRAISLRGQPLDTSAQALASAAN